ncbi:uncharacterized protein LOC118745564 [Rhagoletis pomonella]|uniref:uncharacterized protein LOC118745564 n=1 Tax=Rhagoletis pomonella TaxID=28610 RepID=UPI00177E4D73|nr:uncharacterized protein LOC118745564 [Rhagoletis pomonella]
MESSETKTKHDRATQEQLQRFVSFVRANPDMGKGKNNPKSPQKMQCLWNQLADELNALRGPTRTAVKWKETLGVWKSQLRTRARRLKMSQRITGGGPGCKQLSEFEERALATFGSAAVGGVGVESFELRPSMSEELLVECPASTMASTLPIPAPQSPALLLNPSPSPAVAPISIIVPSQSVYHC